MIKRPQGWNTRVLVGNRSALLSSPAFEQCDLEPLIAQSDFVLPLTSETDTLLSRYRLLVMTLGAMLINLSRGGIIDDAALIDPEVIEHLGTIALDVFKTEPLPLESALRDLPDHILTNHEISHTQENLGAHFAIAVENIQAAIVGTPMPTAFPTTGRY